MKGDALVLFGVTGDLAHKKLYGALAGLEAAGALDVPVIGVASSAWDDAKLRAEVRATLGTTVKPAVAKRLCGRLHFVQGDYSDAATYQALREAGLLERTRIYATDMDTDVLDRASQGAFALDKVRDYTRNYLAAGGTEAFSAYYTVSGDRATFDAALLRPVVFALARTMEKIHHHRGVVIDIDAAEGARFRGEQQDLEEMVGNLVDNAVKFTPEGGRVDIELMRGESDAIVRVTDTGSGISEQEREAVLRRFYRSDKIRSTPGVGLGLNLVAAIVKLHGFRLAIHPGPGGRMEIICPDRQSV